MDIKNELLTTEEAAAVLRRKPQTLRKWSFEEGGPLRPLHTGDGAPLLWRRSDIESFINGGSPEERLIIRARKIITKLSFYCDDQSESLKQDAVDFLNDTAEV